MKGFDPIQMLTTIFRHTIILAYCIVGKYSISNTAVVTFLMLLNDFNICMRNMHILQ